MSNRAWLDSLVRIYRLKSSWQPDCILVWRLREGRGSKFILVVGRIWFLVVAGLQSPFPGWLSA